MAACLTPRREFAVPAHRRQHLLLPFAILVPLHGFGGWVPGLGPDRAIRRHLKHPCIFARDVGAVTHARTHGLRSGAVPVEALFASAVNGAFSAKSAATCVRGGAWGAAIAATASARGLKRQSVIHHNGVWGLKSYFYEASRLNTSIALPHAGASKCKRCCGYAERKRVLLGVAATTFLVF